MERSGEGKRAVSAPRRLRISCPKDPADAEARLDETPLIEKFKKRNLQAFPVPLSAQIGVTATARSKKKRYGSPEAQILLERTNAGNNFAERAEMTSSEGGEDEAPPLPSSTPLERSQSKERAKEDGLAMGVPNIPRRARSSGSRFSSLRRLEHCSAGTSSKQVLPGYQNRSPSPNLLVTKPGGTNNRPLKDLRAIGSPHISDQEVEIAEVLFELSRSIPSFAQSWKKSCRGSKEEDFDSSSSQVAGSAANEHLQKSSCPTLEEPKSKRQCTYLKQEEITLAATSVMAASGIGTVGVDQQHNEHYATSEGFSQKPGFMSIEVMHAIGDKNANHLQQRGEEIVRVKAENNNDEHTFTQDDLASPHPSICKAELCVQVSCKDGEHSFLSSRSNEDQQANGTRSKLDSMCPLMKAITEDDGENAMQADNEMLSLSQTSSIFLKNCGGDKLYSGTTEKSSKGREVLGSLATDAENVSNPGRVLANERNQEGSKHQCWPWKDIQIDLKPLDVKKENDTNVNNLCKDPETYSAYLPLCTLPLTSSNTVTSTGFPPVGYHGKAALPWSRNAFFLGSNLGRKAVIQLPHTTVQQSVPRLKRCATHVYVARYIQQRQQFLRQTFWPPACHREAHPCNQSAFPANLQGKEQMRNNDARLSSLHAGCVTLAGSVGAKMPGLKSENSMSSNSACVFSVGAGTGTSLGHAMSLGMHGQCSHAIMQQNGFASLNTPSNGLPGQNNLVFDKSLYRAHSLPSDVHLTSSLSHLPKHQQVPPPPPSHGGLLHPLMIQPPPQLKQRVQQKQLHDTTITSQHYGAGSDGFSGGDQGCSILNGKQSSKSNQQAQLEGQQAAATPSDSLLSCRVGFEPEVRDVNVSVSKENDLLTTPCKGRETVGPVQLDFATAAVVAKTCEIDGTHDQQQLNLQAQQQLYYQRSYPRGLTTLSTESYNEKQPGYSVEMQSHIEQAGSATDGSKAIESCLPMSVVPSTHGVPASIDQATGSSEIASSSGQLPHQIQKQAMTYVRPFSEANTTNGVSVENACLWGNLGKTTPSPGHTVSYSQNVVKASQRSAYSNGSYFSSPSPGQQVWGNLQSTTNWVTHNSFASRSSSRTSPLCTFPAASSLQAAGSSVSRNNTLSGEGVVVPRKPATTGGPNLLPILDTGEQPSSKVQSQPQGHGQGAQRIFLQQQSIKLQQNRQQPHLSSDKHQQSVDQSESRQQSWPLQAQHLSPQP